MSKSPANLRKPDDPIAFALTKSNVKGNWFEVRIYLHLKHAKLWDLYETLHFANRTEVEQYLTSIYPEITELRINEL